MAIRQGKVSDEVDRELFERERVRGGNRDKRRDGGMGVDFVLLADGTAIDEVFDKGSKARPPEVSFKNHFCMEDTHVARGREGVERVE